MVAILVTTLLFLAVLFVLVLVHEWGHFIAAKKTGMRVDEFGIGFPPRVGGIRRGETLYSINALPIGGFVKIFGEDSDAAASATEYDRSFVAKPKWAQAVVLSAGVIMNVLFAWLLFSVVFAVGVPTTVTEAEATAAATLTITQVLPDSPAAAAGVPVGASISRVAADTAILETPTPSSFINFVNEHANSPLLISYTVNGQEDTATLRATENVIAEQQDRLAIGVALSLVETVRQPIHEAVAQGFVTTITGLRDITIGLFTLITGQSDLSQVAGPVGIAGMVGDAAEFGVTPLLLFTAFISLNLAIINLLPFPALDGGRLLFVAIETVLRRPINPAWAIRLNTVGFALLILLMVVVTFNDIHNLL